MRPVPALRRLGLALASVALPVAFTTPALGAVEDVPHLDHVLVLIMENKSYDQVRVLPNTAFYIAQAASFTSSFGVTHPSQPNYFALWAGSTLGVTNDVCPAPGTPFSAENLGHACEVAGLSWRAYSENLPFVGGTACSYSGNTSSGLYTRKHDPWVSFVNLEHQYERPYPDLATDIANHNLPNLGFIIPNNCHNTHNSSTSGCGILNGDAWLGTLIPTLLGALGPNGVLILTYDEDDNSSQNRILTLFLGARVSPGTISTRSITHYTVHRTICALLGLPPHGVGAGEAPISDIWSQPTAASRSSWGRMKILYR